MEDSNNNKEINIMTEEELIENKTNAKQPETVDIKQPSSPSEKWQMIFGRNKE
jgi:hypothetical protein